MLRCMIGWRRAKASLEFLGPAPYMRTTHGCTTCDNDGRKGDASRGPLGLKAEWANRIPPDKELVSAGMRQPSRCSPPHEDPLHAILMEGAAERKVMISPR